MTFDTIPGTTYLIRIAGKTTSSVGSCALNLQAVTSTPTEPTGFIAPISVREGEGPTLCMQISVSPGTFPTSTGIFVGADFSSVGGSPAQLFNDDGLGCDTVAGDSFFSASLTLDPSLPVGFYSLPFVVSDAQGRTSEGLIQLGVSAVTSTSPCPYCGPMDVIFVIDDTGSMGGALANIKGAVGQIVSTIDCASTGDFRLGLATFKDNVRVVTNLGGSLAAFNAGIAALAAAGGGNVPEASDRGVNAAVNLLPASSNVCQIGNFSGAWRTSAQKIVILVTDALPGSCNDSLTTSLFPTVITSASAQGIRIASVFVGGTTSTNSQLRGIMQAYASGTGGCYVEVPSNGAGTGTAISDCLRDCGSGVVAGRCLNLGAAVFGASETGSSTNCTPARTRDHDVQTFSSSGTVVSTRYANVVGADTGFISGGNTFSHQTDYNVNVTIGASPGEEWCLRVDTRRTGELTFRNNGLSGANASIGAVSGTFTGGASLAAGSLNLPPHSQNTSNGTDSPFSDTAQALLVGVGPATLSLRFQWNSTVQSSGFNGDDVAVRLGVSGPQPGCFLNSKCKAAGYGSFNGVPTRNQANDGHFVTITCIQCVKPSEETCKDFNGLFSDPTSSAAVEGFVTTGSIARALYNPSSLGAGGGAGGGTPPSPDGYIRIEDVAPGGVPIQLIAPSEFRGKWGCGCYDLDFDIRIPKDGVGGSPVCFPTLTLIRNDGFPNAANNPTSSATFTSTTPIGEGLGWVHVKIPMPPPGSSSTLGTWTLSAGSDWDHLLSNVTSAILRGDCSVGLGVLDYDNVCITQSQDCAKPPADLVGWWTFDEKSLPIHEIASLKTSLPGPVTTGLNGPPTFSNAPKPIKGKVGGAFDFDGVDDVVRVSASTPAGNATPFQIATSNFSIDVWIRTSQGIGELPIVDKRSTSYGAPPTGYRLFVLNGRLAFSMGDPQAPGETVCLSSGPFVADGQWHHVAVTVKRNIPSPAIKLYVDCNLVSQCSPNGKTLPLSNNNADLLIGAGHAIGGPPAFFRGAIDELEFFRRDLTQQEICDIYSARCGKCREYCLLRPYLTLLGGGGVSSRICNGTATPKTYTWSFTNTTGAGCTISGLTFSPSSGTVTVPAFGCTTVSAFVGLPPGMTTTDLACYSFAFTDADGARHECKASLRKCDITLCPIILDDGGGFGNPTLLAFPSVGTGTPIRFEMNNSGAARVIPYRFEAVGEDGSTSQIISLNGLPPGEPVFGTLSVQAGSTTPFSVGAAFTNFDMFSGYFIVLSLDINGTGNYEPYQSVAVQPAWRDADCLGQFSDDFDASTQGSVCGQNGWEQWAGSVDVCGQVTRQFAFDGVQSLQIVGNPGGTAGKGDDTVQRVSVNGGIWSLRAMVYVPQSSTGAGYLSMLNTYDDPPGSPLSTYRWSVDITFNADNNTVSVFRSPATRPLIRDRWVEVRVDINLDTDSVNISYDGDTFITGKSWINGSSDAGQARIQAIDLYGGEPTNSGITAMYWDAISLMGQCAGSDCNSNGTDDIVEVLDGGASVDANANGVLDACESACDSIDFNNDTSFFDPIDIDAFLSVYGEGPCIPIVATCNDIDFNNDGSVFDPCDIDSFLLQFSEGPCTLCGQ
ncbi:MAG: LamG-like jellyroll fold domain-containing protein [Phycisphaerales bacterium]